VSPQLVFLVRLDSAEQLLQRKLRITAIMPIMHIVLFKLKEGVSEDAIKAMNEAVSSMGKLDCVQSINCGTNFTDRGRGMQAVVSAVQHPRASRSTNKTARPLAQ
jgi:hypothetical protein